MKKKNKREKEEKKRRKRNECMYGHFRVFGFFFAFLENEVLKTCERPHTEWVLRGGQIPRRV